MNRPGTDPNEALRQYGPLRPDHEAAIRDVIKKVHAPRPDAPFTNEPDPDVGKRFRAIAGTMARWPLASSRGVLIEVLSAALETWLCRGMGYCNYQHLDDVLHSTATRTRFTRLRHELTEPTMAQNARDEVFLYFPPDSPYVPMPTKGFAGGVREYIHLQDSVVSADLNRLYESDIFSALLPEPSGTCPHVTVELGAFLNAGRAIVFLTDANEKNAEKAAQIRFSLHLKRLRLLMVLLGVHSPFMEDGPVPVHVDQQDERALLASSFAYLKSTSADFLHLIPIRGERLWSTYQFALCVGKTLAEAASFSRWRYVPIEPRIASCPRAVKVTALYILRRGSVVKRKRVDCNQGRALHEALSHNLVTPLSPGNQGNTIRRWANHLRIPPDMYWLDLPDHVDDYHEVANIILDRPWRPLL